MIDKTEEIFLSDDFEQEEEKSSSSSYLRQHKILPKSRIEDIKNSNKLTADKMINKDNMILPREISADYFKPEPIPVIIKTKPVVEEKPTVIKEEPKRNFILPRAKNFAVDYKDLDINPDITIDLSQVDPNNSKILKREIKRLTKEKTKANKYIDKNDRRINSMKTSSSVNTEELTATIEVRDKYVRAMKEIDKNIQKINSVFSDDMPLSERRKQIYSNANLAANERVRRIMYLRKKDLKSDKFKRLYPKQEEVISNPKLAIHRKKNPFYERMKMINDNGGITLSMEYHQKKDRISDNWNKIKRGESKISTALSEFNSGEAPEVNIYKEKSYSRDPWVATKKNKNN